MSTIMPPAAPSRLPDHLQLPERDGRIVENFQGHPQGTLLTDTLRPVLQARHPDDQYCIGYDSGIYWRITDPPLDGCKAPDWFYVPDVPPMLDGILRRSYVMWQEHIPPHVLFEFVSGDGSEERDQTPWRGKFWVYERVIRPAYYGIFDGEAGRLDLYQLVANRFQLVPANERGHFPIATLGVEIGIWFGRYDTAEVNWLRWWDAQGNLLPTSDERAAQYRRAMEISQERAERLAAQLRAQGIEPEA
jgi:Uma2 family endonuclease